MTVVCGTDFSDAAREAVAVAAKLSCRMKQSLLLVHAVVPQPGDPIAVDLEPARAAMAEALERDAAELRTAGLEVTTRAVIGWADEVLTRVASDIDADLMVLGAIGHRRGAHWLIGSVAENVAKTTPTPLLLVRDRQSLDRWIEGQEVLRVVLATDFSPVSDFALDWLQKLSSIGPTEALLTYVANPAIESARMNLSGPVSRKHLHPIVDEVIRRELRDREKRIALGGIVRTCVKLSLDAPGQSIIETVTAENAGLVVVGAHQRGWLDRMWTGSVAQAVVHDAPANVVVVPFHTADERFRALETPEIHTILAATDLSPCGNHAVAWAMGVAPHGSKVIVFNAAAGPVEHARAAAELAQMNHPRSWPEDVVVETDITEQTDVPKAICAAAQRCAADMIVVGAHGHSRLRMILGSVPRELLALSTKPVLVVRDQAE
ncbi:MAG TPA: universal stress protein [Thermoanaerobaculia bacterium]|nr:universal stress protein [Thermoanaerobaculia bacterium]